MNAITQETRQLSFQDIQDKQKLKDMIKENENHIPYLY